MPTADEVKAELARLDELEIVLNSRPIDDKIVEQIRRVIDRRAQLLAVPARPRHFKVVLIIPSRGRPQAALLAAESALSRADIATTAVWIAVDGAHDTEQHHAYLEIPAALAANVHVHTSPTHRGLVGTLNYRAAQVARTQLMKDHRCDRGDGCQRVTHIGFMGDDHRVRTDGWDRTLAEAAGEWGIAYGNDLLRGAELPTSVMMSADIIRVLGKMCPAELWHMYCDDYWKALGSELGRLAYLPDVVIEHLHPAAGKAQVDESYHQTNNPEVFSRDAAAWDAYIQGGLLAQDAAAINAEIRR